MNLCFVIQRYGLESPGGAETHCRWLATRLARNAPGRGGHDLRPGLHRLAEPLPGGRQRGATGSRSRASRWTARGSARPSRSTRTSSSATTTRPRTKRSGWTRTGLSPPRLVEALPAMRHVDLFLFYSYRYYTTFRGLPRVAGPRGPRPHRRGRPGRRLPIFRPLFQAPRGLIYLTPEEQALVESARGNGGVPSVVVGSGVDVPAGWRDVDVPEKFGLPRAYVLYVGRIDRNKGVDRLLDYHRELRAEWPQAPPLVLAGTPTIAIPEHPKVRHLGVVSDAGEARAHRRVPRCW